MAKPSSAAESFFDEPRPIAIAHRGGDAAGWSKRNSMAAFQSAYKLGFKYVELDVIRAASGEIVVIHGSRNKLDEMATGQPIRRQLQKMTYEDIKKQIIVDDESPPLLIDVLESFPDLKLFVETKSSEVVGPLVDLIQTRKLSHKICISSFAIYYNRIRLATRLSQGSICTSLILDRASSILRLSKTSFRKLLRASHRYPILHVNSFQVPTWFVSHAMISEAHEEGRKLISWNANTKEEILNLLDKNVDGITSDKTELLKQTILAKDPNNKSFR